MMNYRRILVFVLVLGTSHGLLAQEKQPLENRVNLLFGVGQLLQQGYNVEGNLFLGRWAFDYSHGVSLDINNDQLENGSDQEQGLAVHIPWTTGFGVGYRFNDWLNLRAEPKWHKFELSYDDPEPTTAGRIGDYTTFTLGLGLYANLRPFKKHDSFLKGVMVAPNVRWWPRVSSSLADNTLRYDNQVTGQTETHTARQIGIGNTPFFVNVSVGYSIGF